MYSQNSFFDAASSTSDIFNGLNMTCRSPSYLSLECISRHQSWDRSASLYHFVPSARRKPFFGLCSHKTRKNLHRDAITEHRKMRVQPAGNAKENYGTLPNACDWPLRAAAWSTMERERHRP